MAGSAESGEKEVMGRRKRERCGRGRGRGKEITDREEFESETSEI